MFIEIKAYKIYCDKCNTGFVDDEYNNSFVSQESALRAAIDYNWIEKDGRHYCENCRDGIEDGGNK